VNALAFEGDLSGAFTELKALLLAFEDDPALIPESMGGIDWHLGFAVYEFLQRPFVPESQALWLDFAVKEPFTSILGRALDFYARWHQEKDEALVATYFQRYEAGFSMKARLMYVQERPLVEGNETEVGKAREFFAIAQAAQDQSVRMSAIEAAIESFIRGRDYNAALDLIEKATVMLGPEGITRLGELETRWLERIAEGIEVRDERRRTSRIEAAKDMIGQIKTTLGDARIKGRVGEAGRLEVLLVRQESKLRELTGE